MLKRVSPPGVLFFPRRHELTGIFFLTQPPPPEWLTKALADLNKLYPHDQFEGMMKYSALDAKTDQPVSLQAQTPDNGNANARNVQYVFLPRIRCRDCPGKLYTPGPEMTTVNFEVHLKNKNHRERVNTRVGRDTRAGSSGGQQGGGGSQGGSGSTGQMTAMGSQSSQ